MKKEILELLGCYGYTLELEDTNQHKMRFKSETAFVDIWLGKKRNSLGVYNSDTKKMSFSKFKTLEELENKLTTND